jgi:hypothetical protein
MPKKSQSAIEFVVLASFMFLVILVLLGIIGSTVIDANEEDNRKTAEDITEFAYKELETANSVSDGYVRTFSMPQTVNGIEYSISLVDNRELTVNYLGYEHVKFIHANVSGNLSVGTIQLNKIKGVVHVMVISECSDGIDNDLDNLIDLLDAGCNNASDSDETNCGDNRCEGPESCLSCSFDCGACFSPTTIIFKNSLSNVLRLDENGNAILKGALQQNTNPLETPDDEFIVKDAVNGNLAIVNLATGNMAIKGTLKENQGILSPSPAEDNFVIKDSGSGVLGYVDSSGNLFLKGTFTENGSP